MMGVKTDTRDRMVASAALVLRERGVAGTSIARVLEHSGGPRGSVGFHFPGGKVELVSDGLRWAGNRILSRLKRAATLGAAPAEIFTDVCAFYTQQLRDSEFRAGCPIGAAAQEAYDDPALGAVIGEIIEGWLTVLEDALVAAGHERARAADLALLCLSSLEGAILLCRVTRSTRPLDTVLANIRPLLNAE